MQPRILTFAALGLTSLLLACNAEPEAEQRSAEETEQASELPPSLEASEEGESNQGGTNVMNETERSEMSLEQAVEAARMDLADRTGTSAEGISVADARRVTWANGALGCPEEGMMYTQALVEGYYIRLQADGVGHDYHAGSDGKPFFCPGERSQRPPTASGDPEM